MNELDFKIRDASDILDDAIAIHKPSHVFAMFSGGHDSLCATHLTSKHPRFSGVVHVNTTIGIEETRKFVRSTCEAQGWKLLEYYPPVSYRDIVLKHGFPGPGGHHYMYIRLKERCVAQLTREHKTKWNDRIVLVTGVRLQESKRRMGHVVAITRHKARVWTAPILDWSTDDKDEYIDRHALPRNPVVQQLCMSGECLCGSFMHPGERHEIEVLYPETAAIISQLEADARAAGVHAEWGKRPPKKNKLVTPDNGIGLCWSCEAKAEEIARG